MQNAYFAYLICNLHTKYAVFMFDVRITIRQRFRRFLFNRRSISYYIVLFHNTLTSCSPKSDDHSPESRKQTYLLAFLEQFLNFTAKLISMMDEQLGILGCLEHS